MSIEAAEEVNARKSTLGETDALALVEQVNELYAARGRNVVHLNLRKDRPDNAELKKLLLGPTGNLRAPTLRKGKTLIVGFHEETYQKVFG